VIRLALILAAWSCAAQDASLNVFSEFRRIDPYGRIVTADQGGKPREILSPAVARNAKETPTWLYIQQNPEHFRVDLYREQYVKAGKEWIPDGLQPVKAPCFLVLPEPGTAIPGQKTQSYWLDLWIPADAPVERVRVQVVIKVDENWIQYPMEVRVVDLVSPGRAPLPSEIPRLAQSMAQTWLGGWTAPPGPAPEAELSVRHLLMRNARQDRALADAALPPAEPSSSDPEWPLDWRRSLLHARRTAASQPRLHQELRQQP
jgi:hypothetical protein